MIPHHENAVNMAKLVLKQDYDAISDDEELMDILYGIINVQNYQVHSFRNYLNPEGKLLEAKDESVLVDMISTDCESSDEKGKETTSSSVIIILSNAVAIMFAATVMLMMM